MELKRRGKRDIREVFQEGREQDGFLKVAAPMVRYSKLEFRRLLKKHGVRYHINSNIIS